jgi:3-methylfumaryl-CoA hydratase
MWAGGRVTFHAPLLLGETVTKTSTILKIEAKSGKSGHLVFVTVRHQLTGTAGLALTEEQDIVYKEASAPQSLGTGPAMPAPDAPTPETPYLHTLTPDPVLLFRYSALTMNGHRIHYDRPYAMAEEAYPALVVHGPLQATMLAALAATSLPKPLKNFAFRSQTPAFDGPPLHVCGEPTPDGATLWTTQGGIKNMVATATV